MAQDTASATIKLRSLTQKFDAAVLATVPYYPRISSIVPSSGADEEYAQLGAPSSVREWLGEREFDQPRAQRFVIVNALWESSEAIQKTDIDDDRLGLYGTRLAEMGKRAARHPDELLINLINVAQSTLSLDGQNFFDTDHEWGISGVQSNLITVSGIADPANPTPDEAKKAYMEGLHVMLAFKDDKGKNMHQDFVVNQEDSVSVTVLTDLDLRQNMIDALNAALTGGGNTNIVINRADVAASPTFTTANAFDIYRTDVEFKPYVFQARDPLTREMKHSSSSDIEFKDVKFMTRARYQLGVGAWWNAVRILMTT